MYSLIHGVFTPCDFLTLYLYGIHALILMGLLQNGPNTVDDVKSSVDFSQPEHF